MKRLQLTPVEVHILRDMEISHSHPRTRMRAQAVVRLNQGLTLQQVANEFAVHLNSVEHWRQYWNKDGLTGMYDGHHSGRPPKWNETQQQVLRDLANIVVIDNAAIHKGETIDSKRRQWAAQGLYLYYLPPYSPELTE